MYQKISFFMNFCDRYNITKGTMVQLKKKKKCFLTGKNFFAGEETLFFFFWEREIFHFPPFSTVSVVHKHEVYNKSKVRHDMSSDETFEVLLTLETSY